MTGYTPEELAQGWEFKILRSATGAFKNPAFLQQALADEGKAGWTLIEKFDNSRIRLKRPASARSADAALGFDPYRTFAGISENRLGLIIVGCVLGGMALLILIILLLTHRH